MILSVLKMITDVKNKRNVDNNSRIRQKKTEKYKAGLHDIDSFFIDFLTRCIKCLWGNTNPARPCNCSSFFCLFKKINISKWAENLPTFNIWCKINFTSDTIIKDGGPQKLDNVVSYKSDQIQEDLTMRKNAKHIVHSSR